jgi:hypothetical protein
MIGEFLPHIEVTTIVWSERGSEELPYDSAQGDDLKNNRPIIEISFPRLLKGNTPPEVATAMIESWLKMYLIFATRQDLINKHIRGSVSQEAHNILYDANFRAITQSPELKRSYFILAVDRILSGQWIIDDDFKELVEEVKSDLKKNIPVAV